ncbi:MAG: PD-(D/E)XK nuclease family protein [archaeon]|nr:PD-(D/E)XK nuclease family protein [archaeon]
MIYSNSRLNCFEQCPKKFEFKYLQRVGVPERLSIEAFLGKKVHEALEKLFKDLQHTKKNSLEDLLIFFEKKWKEDWRESIIVSKEDLSVENYFELGKKCLTNFYKNNHPFERGKIIGIEKKISIDLNNDGKHKLTGVIDLLVQVNKNHFQIQDYKTTQNLPVQKKMEQDMQLALYQLWVEKEFPEAKKIDLIWHYLVFEREGISHRNKKQLEQLKKKLIALINKIEATERFETKVSPLCNYCEYKHICPAWTHQEMVEGMDARQYKKEEGVILVDEYASAYRKKQELLLEVEEKLEKLKQEIFAYAEQHKFEVIIGSDCRLKIKTMEKLRFPAKHSQEREKLEQLIKKHNLWNQLTELDTAKLLNLIEEGELDKKIAKELEKFAQKYETKSIYLGKK